MTREEEAASLAPFFEKASVGGILVVGEIKQALDERPERTGVLVFESEVENADSLLHVPIRLFLRIGTPGIRLKKSQHIGCAVYTRLSSRPEDCGFQANRE
jgi:hypothetical protein